MLRPLLLAALLAAASVPAPRAAAGVEDSAPFVRVTRGSVRLQQGQVTQGLGPSDGEVQLAPGPVALVAGARTELELAWRGRASARIAGPAHLALTGEPRLRLTSFQSVELEVRRGTLAFEAPGLFEAELAGGAVQLCSPGGGVVEVQNRGGQALELWPAGGARGVVLAPGERHRFPGR